MSVVINLSRYPVMLSALSRTTGSAENPTSKQTRSPSDPTHGSHVFSPSPVVLPPTVANGTLGVHRKELDRKCTRCFH